MAGKAFDRVVDAFHGQGLKVRVLGEGKATGQAPGHSNADQSVSITDIGGRVLVWSHSDPTDTVLSGLNLSMTDLFDEPKGVTYTYGDGRNVSRTPFKKFSQSGNTKGNQLYRADRLAGADVVAFVEGEQDVHALESIGVTATCTAMGAGKAHLFDLTPLYGKTVLVIRDMDEPGLNHAAQVIGLLEGKARVIFMEPAEGKDAADHIASGHTLSDFVKAELPKPVEPIDPGFEAEVEFELRKAKVRATAKDREREANSAPGDKLNPKLLGEILDAPGDEYDWLVPGLLERRDRCVVTGGEGSGKSYFLRQLAIAMAAGIHPFDQYQQTEPVKVAVVDAENTEEQWRRTTRYVTDVSSRHGSGDPRNNVYVSAGVRLDLTRQADVNEVHRILDQHKPGVLYIGPFYKLLSKSLNSEDDSTALIVALDSFRERGVTLLMEAHAGHTKSLGGERDMRPRGSAALLGWPEFGFGLSPMPDTDTLMNVVKWRGDRDVRDWPTALRRGTGGELPWMALAEGAF